MTSTHPQLFHSNDAAASASPNGMVPDPSTPEQYIAAGIPIFPLKARDKRPATTNGFYDASTNPDQIDTWLDQYPGCNWGMPTGEASGFDVLDIDGDEGLASLRAWEAEHGPLPQSARSRTGNGLHILFQHDDRIHNSVKLMRPGWDTRGTGGYIVIAPSIHPDTGEPYQWETSPFAVNVPDWPNELMQAYEQAERQQRRSGVADSGLIYHGTQEDTLMRIAGGMRRQGSTETEILAALRTTSDERCVPPVQEPDLQRMAASVCRYDPEHPLLLLDLTDTGNGERFAYVNRDRAHWSEVQKDWYRWDGQRWKIEPSRQIDKWAKETIRATQIHAVNMPDTNSRRGDLLDFTRRSESDRALNAMVNRAKSELEISVDAFDRNPWLFNCTNGTLDLRTGELRPHNPADYITQLAPVPWEPEATCPLWEGSLSYAMGGDPRLAYYLQKIVGIFLSGDVSQKFLPILHGEGDTGKTTFTNTLYTLLGDDYAQTVNESMLAQASKGSAGEKPEPEMVDLLGARVGIASETNAGLKLNEARVKNMTGRGRIKAARKHQHPITFNVTHKLLIETNDRPVIEATSSGMWARVHLVPFLHRIAKVDERFEEKLATELPGILAWAVRGCMAWQRHGLHVPKAIRVATAEYKQEMDTIGEFVTERCVLDAEASVGRTELLKAYQDSTRFPKGRNTFNEYIAGNLGCAKWQHPQTKAESWKGIGLLATKGTAFTRQLEGAE